MQVASQKGQTIYTITKENYNQVLPKLSLSANVMSDIQNAINADKVVTVHEKISAIRGGMVWVMSFLTRNMVLGLI